MSKLILVRNPSQYAQCSPQAIAEGSQAQMMHFVADAKKDIVSLCREVERLTEERDRIERNRDMYRGQVERQASALESMRGECTRLTAALEAIRDLEPQPFNAYPADWDEQIAACDDCQRYKDHPLMRGICDTHRKPMYDRESHDAHQVRSLGYRAKSMARDALGAAKEITQ